MLRNNMRVFYKNFNNFVTTNLNSFLMPPFKFDFLILEEKILGNH